MDAEKMSAAKKWAMIGLLTFFGRAIANVPYMREVYYDQVIEALSITNTQLGILSSAVGIASIFGYFFGGFLADRFSSKKIIILSGLMGESLPCGMHLIHHSQCWFLFMRQLHWTEHCFFGPPMSGL